MVPSLLRVQEHSQKGNTVSRKVVNTKATTHPPELKNKNSRHTGPSILCRTRHSAKLSAFCADLQFTSQATGSEYDGLELTKTLHTYYCSTISEMEDLGFERTMKRRGFLPVHCRPMKEAPSLGSNSPHRGGFEARWTLPFSCDARRCPGMKTSLEESL